MSRQELITHHEALLHATNPESLQMSLRGISSSKSVTEAGKHVVPGQPKPPVKPPPAPPVNGPDHDHAREARRPVATHDDEGNPLDRM